MMTARRKAQEATRDYVLKLDAPAGEAPLLSVFGGKITTFRRLAEAGAGASSRRPFPFMRAPWTATATLPGGDFKVTSFEAWAHSDFARRIFLPRPGARRSGFSAPMARASAHLCRRAIRRRILAEISAPV